MDVLIADPLLAESFILERQRLGHVRHDEVWDGVYVVSPEPNNEHQRILALMVHCFVEAVHREDLGSVSAGGNVSDRAESWTENFRCPDLAVYLHGGTAEDRDTHWFGGPDFAVEIVSKGDRSREKLDFYASVGTRELLLIDRYPWAVELYRLEGGKLTLVGRSTLADPRSLESRVLPVSFRLVEGPARPLVAMVHADGERSWSA